jgi:hypothetical protein
MYASIRTLTIEFALTYLEDRSDGNKKRKEFQQDHKPPLQAEFGYKIHKGEKKRKISHASIIII